MFFAAGKPFHFFRRHAVLMLQDAARPGRHGDLILGNADAFAGHVGGFFDARIGVDVDARVAKRLRRKHRNTDQARRAFIARHEKRARGHFRHVKFAVAQHAPKGLFDAQRQISEIHPFHFDAAILKARVRS